jgi:hypothetical protein
VNIIFYRWLARFILTIGEVILIGYVIYLIFGGGVIEEGLMNSLSVVLGALMLNFGKSSSYWFSTESNEKEVEKVKK